MKWSRLDLPSEIDISGIQMFTVFGPNELINKSANEKCNWKLKYWKNSVWQLAQVVDFDGNNRYVLFPNWTLLSSY
jgi:hypothetical protein